MKINFSNLAAAYSFTFCVFIFIFMSAIPECECIWMHDASIVISHGWVIIHCSYLFLLPIILLLVLKRNKTTTLYRPFILHYLTSVISMSSIAIAVNKPCQFINGGHYMFININTVLIYYISSVVIFFFVCYLFYKTVNACIRPGQTRRQD